MSSAARLHDLARGTIVVSLLTFVPAPGPMSAAPTYGDWSDPVNLGPEINSSANEMGPALSKDELSLYFQTNRAGGLGRTDLWVSRRPDRDAPWGQPDPLPFPLNTEFTEGGPVFSRDGHWMFFNSDRPGGSGGTDIWASWRAHVHDDFGWEAPFNLGPEVNTASGESTGSYFENDEIGTPLFFLSSNRPGAGPAPGGPYVSARLPDGSFSLPMPVTELDSPLDDMRPMIRFDGREILLSSGRAGSLARDLWVAVRESVFDEWDTPSRVIGINTGANELTPFLSADGRTLVFASDRLDPNARGGVDLYVSTRQKGHGRQRQ
jgi:hypothetical protein